MKFLRKIATILIVTNLIFVTACEEEGNPLTLDDIYEAQEADRPLFRALLNGRGFTSEKARGSKVGDDIIIDGSNATGSILINLSDYLPGKYAGTDSVTNQIVYTDKWGRKYLSNRADEQSDAEIVITYYDEVASTVSGRFSALLYDSWYERDIYLSNGVFTDLFINVPFFGRMDAVIENGAFESQNCRYSRTISGSVITDRIIAISTNDTARVVFRVDGGLESKTYSISDSNFFALYNADLFFNASKNSYNGESGDVVVSSIDPINRRVKGSFNFNAINALGDTVNVIAGEFNALMN